MTDHEKQIQRAFFDQVNEHGRALAQLVQVVNAHTQTLQTFSADFTNSFRKVAHDMNSVMDRLDKLEQQKEKDDEQTGDNDGSSSSAATGDGDHIGE